MIDIYPLYGVWCFSNNPVPVIIRSEGKEVVVEIRSRERVLFEASYMFPEMGVVDISDILKSVVSVNDCSLPGSLFCFGCDGQVAEFFLRMYSVDGTVKMIDRGPYKVVYGGIEKSLFRRFSEAGIRPFDYLFKSNFSLSTRSANNFFCIRETEIAPLKLFTGGKSVEIVSPAEWRISIPDSDSDIVLVDLAAIRRDCFNVLDLLPAYFSFFLDGVFRFRIYFTPGLQSGERLLLRFRNSLGGYELLEITGKSFFSAVFESDNEVYSAWDPAILDFRTVSSPKRSTAVIEANTGFKDRDELRFILDLLHSEEVFLISDTGANRVLVSADSFKFPVVISEPQSIALKIKYADTESNYSPSMGKDIVVPEKTWFLETGSISGDGLILYNKTINSI